MGIILLFGISNASADDRVLLRAEGAPAYVLLILDSGVSMTHDPETNCINFLGSGDNNGEPDLGLRTVMWKQN